MRLIIINITTIIIATITATVTAKTTAETTTTMKSTISYFQMKVCNNFMAAATAFAACDGSMTLQAEKINLTIINNKSKVNNMAKW